MHDTEILCAIPGRLRLRWPALVRADLRTAVESRLRALPGVTVVDVAAARQRLLVSFDASLTTLDQLLDALGAPARPAVRGELKIRGYSSYLHPVGGSLLLGIGQDATDEGRVLGVQASLFDVSDLRRPRRLDALQLGTSWSAAEGDHHAFLWWPRSRLAVIPLATAGDRPFTGAVGLRVSGRSLTAAGRLTHAVAGTPQASEPVGPAILRSFVVGDSLYTVSEVGLKASSLTTLADTGFVRFSS